MIKISTDHRHEYPIEFFWYTKHAGHSIEYIIDHDISFFEWIVGTFQDITQPQADYYRKKTGREIPKECIQKVIPYTHQIGDPEQLYSDLCKTRDLNAMIFKWRNKNQLNLF